MKKYFNFINENKNDSILVVCDLQKEFSKFIPNGMVDAVINYCNNFHSVYQIWDSHEAEKPSYDVNKWWKSPGFTDGLHAYVVNRKGADKLIAHMATFVTTNDDAVNDARFSPQGEPLIAYALKHKIAFQIEDFSELDRKIIKRDWR